MKWSLPSKIVSGIASLCAFCPLLWWIWKPSESQGLSDVIAKSNWQYWILPALGSIPFVGKYFHSKSDKLDSYSVSDSYASGERRSGPSHPRRKKDTWYRVKKFWRKYNTFIMIGAGVILVILLTAIAAGCPKVKKPKKKRIIVQKKPARAVAFDKLVAQLPDQIAGAQVAKAGVQALRFAKRFQNFRQNRV